MEDPRDEYKILPNIVPQSYANTLEEELSNMHWYYYPSASGKVAIDKNDVNIIDSPQMQHVFIEDNESISPYSQLIKPVIWFFEKATGLTVKNIVRVKANLLTPGRSTLSNYNIPHIDSPNDDYVSMVYYVNGGDGDTKIFHKTIDEGHEDLYTIASVEPKKGRAVMFKSNRFHASTPPFHAEKRIVINYVLQIGTNNDR